MTLDEFNKDKAVIEFIGSSVLNSRVIAVAVPERLTKMVDLLGEDFTIQEVTFGDLFGSLYASWKLCKDNPEELKQWSTNALLVLQGQADIDDNKAGE